MLAAPVLDLPPPAPSRRTGMAALALSAALHVALAAVWGGIPLPEAKPEGERAITVELAPPPPPPPAEGGPAKPAAEGPPAEARPVPQLEDGMLARQSSPPAPKREAAPPTPQVEAAAPKPKKPAPVTQNERDLILSQVIRHWHPPRELAAYDQADLHVGVVVDAEGWFDGDYDARRRWNPEAVFEGYDTLPPHSIQRRTVDAFYQAIRKAQPVRLPPELKAKAPFKVRLDFRFKDAPKTRTSR